MVEVSTLFVAFVFLFVYYIYRKYKCNIWNKLDIVHLTGYPIFGNDFRFIMGLETNVDSQARKYRYFGKNKYGGTFMFARPFLFVKDPELIESILVKEFTSFYDRGIPVSPQADPLQAHLFNLSGKTWKNLRHKLSPVFTSGKLKTMHHQLIDCADVLMQIIDKYSTTGEPLDFKEMIAKFTTDVIGSCAYGINMNSLTDDDSEFRRMGRKVLSPSTKEKLRSVLRQILRSIHPDLVRWLGMKTMPKEIDDFFFNLVDDTIKLREDNPQYERNDFIQLLVGLRKQDKLNLKDSNSNQVTEVELDNSVLAANAFLFFVAGFETTASTISYCLFELAKNQDIQESVHDEVVGVLSKHQGEPTYDAIKNMPLLDMVIAETLRKYPPVPFLMRIATEPFKLPDRDLVLPVGIRVEIPVYTLHHDPDIYSEPERFIPERFSPENIDRIPKGAYLPFGDGPRICIGARFAQMEMKVCLSKILAKYRVTKNAKTPDTIQFDPKSLFIMVPKGGIWLDVAKR